VKRRGWFITATDTGVGKTYFSCALVRALRQGGIKAGVLKPVETGCSSIGAGLVPADALKLKAASRTSAELDLINPYRFSQPISPSIAEKISKRRIDFRKIGACFEKISASHDVVVVEGAGGILSPISKDRTNAQLARYLKLPVVIVVPDRLGAINQALMAVNAARVHGLEVSCVILNSRKGRAKADSRVGLDRAEIEKFGRVRVVAIGK